MLRRILSLSHSLITSAAMAASVATAGSLVPNPNFEAGADAALADWRCDCKAIPDTADGLTADNGAKIVWDRLSTEGGERSLRLSSTGRPDQGYTMVASAPIHLLPNTVYEIAFRYRAEGLQKEDDTRSSFASVIVDLFINDANGRVDGCRLMTSTNSTDWGTINKTMHHGTTFRTPEIEGCWGQLRMALRNELPNNAATVWFDEVMIRPVDPSLRNVSFEEGEDAPSGWTAIGSGKTARVGDPVRTGKVSVSVADAGQGELSGWSQSIPVRDDRSYSFAGYVRTQDINPDGFVGGGALALVFLDADGQPLGTPVLSAAVGGTQTEWQKVATPPMQAPSQAVTARLTAGLQFCRGTAWFDDLSLEVATAAVKESLLLRRDPVPDASVTYLPNLLFNGDLEAGEGDVPAGWTYHGKADMDWTEAEIAEFHTEGRPKFSIGRGRGEWVGSGAYAGQHALLDIHIEPPLSKHSQWYGRNAVDAFWLSDAMPCTPGALYCAGGWLRPSKLLNREWYGPLELRFYDAGGRQLKPGSEVRGALAGVEPGSWIYWPVSPVLAPERAATMRLRFGHELDAAGGGQGRMLADNLAVWELPAGIEAYGPYGGNSTEFFQWFYTAHARLKPPYAPSPAKAVAYESVIGRLANLTDGNLYHSTETPIPLRFELQNQLGEARDVRLSVTRTDWLGKQDPTITSDLTHLSGTGAGEVLVDLPPSGAYGAFHLEVEVTEGGVVVGKFAGRYAILPPLLRPRTGLRPWGVTPLVNLKIDGSAYERELAELLRVAGFSVSWVRMQVPENLERRADNYAEARKEIQWYRSLGIEPVLQLMIDWPRKQPRTITYDDYFAIGKELGETFGGLAKTMGNFNIETANSKSPFRGGGEDRLTDTEYDTMMAAVYDGIKSVSPDTTVLIGNIATDTNADTIRRLYGKIGKGKFDGAIFNAYAGQQLVLESFLKEFDAHGDTHKIVMNEEQANQRSPWDGPLRRFGEAAGAANMVRTWVALASRGAPRLQAVTMWGFNLRTPADIMMVTTDLQPRPQFVAHAVMADALADAQMGADRSTGNLSLYEWTRGDGPIIVAWANAGEQDVTFEIERDGATSLDLMGNATPIETRQGLATLHLTTTPVFLYGGGRIAVSERLQVALCQGTLRQGEPLLQVALTNNSDAPMKGTLALAGPVKDAQKTQPFDIAPGATQTLQAAVNAGLPTGTRTIFGATCTTESGAVFASSAGLDFVSAVRVDTAPALDGSWKGWESATAIPFGTTRDEIKPTTVAGEDYTGVDDLRGSFRVLWDAAGLYLGVEADDDAFTPVPDRGRSGFRGDSIEFTFQPQHDLTPTAPRWEYEMYLPAGETAFAASRRWPAPAAMVEGWRGIVKPTGKRGGAVYQVLIPWADLGLDAAPQPGTVFGCSFVINDQDNPANPFTGGRGLVHWFSGLHAGKNPELYGDLTLVAP